MSHYLATYRWELWLLVGIPAIAVVLGHVLQIAGSFLLGLFSPLLLPVISAAIGLILLALSYPFVRGLGREFLTLLWGYLVIASVIGTVMLGVLYVAWGDSFETGGFTYLGRALTITGIATVPRTLALLWFARQVSRLSLAHAYFLVAFTMLARTGFVQSQDTFTGFFDLYAGLLTGFGIALCVALLKVWLLGNFDERGAEFRRNGVIGLVVATVIAGYVGVLISQILGFGEGQFSAISPLLDVVAGLFAFNVLTGLTLLEPFVVVVLVFLLRVRSSRAEEPRATRSLR